MLFCRSAFLTILLGVICTLTGCSSTPRQMIQGRWYNKNLSIRFRSDGTVLYNSRTTGMAVGRYYLNPDIDPVATNEPAPNLTLDLLINNRTVRTQMEAEFLGADRLKIQTYDADAPADDDEVRPSMVLVRAESDADAAPLAASR